MGVITKEVLQQKIASFQAQHNQLTADANACTGAIQACEHLLQELDQPDLPPPSPPHE
jgi:prefoldin subunit 5